MAVPAANDRPDSPGNAEAASAAREQKQHCPKGLESLLVGAEAVAQRVRRGQASHKWRVTNSRMGRRVQIGLSVAFVSPPRAPEGYLRDSLREQEQRRADRPYYAGAPGATPSCCIKP